MKKLFVFFFLVIVVAMFIASCKQEVLVPQDLKISIKTDTTIYRQNPITKPLYSCGSGVRSAYNKLVRMDSIPEKISIKKDTIISGKSLVGTIVPIHKKGSGLDLSWLLPTGGWILGIALLLFLLMLLGWLFYRLWQEISRRRNKHLNCEEQRPPLVVDIRNNSNIDSATTAAIITEERAHRERVLDKMLEHGNLSNITLACSDFYLEAKYKDGEPLKKEDPSEPKPGDQQQS